MVDRVGHQLGNYRLLRELGRGAFAEVYLAEHLYLERLAAIKVLHVQMDPDTQEHFRREARTVARLQHPHILQVLDFGIDEQTPYLVMQYTPGGTLREHHPKGTRLPVEQIVTYVKQIASALDYAHQQRVIHRDIKPHNLLLTATSEVVLGDFGLAVMQRSLDALSLSNPNAGTPLYMAPEQIQYRPCPASDQYALGVMVYEWLAGEPPFDGKTVFEVFSHHLYQAPPSLREQLPDLPAAVEAVVFKALAKDPEQRFACVTDFAAAFEEACEITQRLTMLEPVKQRAQEPMVSQKTLFVPPVPTRAPEASSASTQPAPITVPGTERGSVAVLVADRPTTSKPVKSSLAQNNRQRFLRRVRAIWIEGMLNHSLQGAALIALGLQEQVDALANPWHLVLHHPDTAPRAFPVGTRIVEVYDAANEELLILGAPGSGKTTLVLELARDLLDRAEQDAHHLIPVVFPLSSCAAKSQSLTEWMIEELISKYQVPRQLARTWIDTDQILPLLDGLDEVATEKRTTCIETINTYHQEHPFLPLVVSSRSADYLQQSGRLKLTTAVTIQSLTQQQVDEYLAQGGESLWALRVALHQDESLRELAETPLMLSILTLTYHDMPVEDLLRGGIAPTRQQIFEHYVGRMLLRRRGKRQYQFDQMVSQLAWLARQLTQHNQTIFYIEQIQLDWLSDERFRQFYPSLMRVIVGLFVAVFFSVIGRKGFGEINLLLSSPTLKGHSLLSTPVNPVTSMFIILLHGFSLEGGLIIVLVGAVIGGLMSRANREIELLEIIVWSWEKVWQSPILYLLSGFVGSLLVLHLLIGFFKGLDYLIGGLLIIIMFLWVGDSWSGLESGYRVTPHQNIWRSTHAALLAGILAGLSVWLYLHLFLSYLEIFVRLEILVIGMILWVIVSLFIGWSTKTMAASSRVRPNQGTWRSLHNGIIIGLLITLLVTLFVGILGGMNLSVSRSVEIVIGIQLIDGKIAGWIFGLLFGLFIGVLAGLLAGLQQGGIEWLKHYVLRFLLWRTKSIPWNYPRFLDYAAEHILLRKVGGGYIFVHRLLLEYFASLNTTPLSDATGAKK